MTDEMSGQQEPWARNQLEELLVKAASATEAEDRDAFVHALLRSDVVIPGSMEEGDFVPLILEFHNNPYVPFFTGEERMRSFASVSGIASPVVFRMTCRELWASSLAHNCATVLNPGNPYGKEFLLPEMSDLLRGITPGTQRRTIQHEEQVSVGEPAVIPEGLLEVLQQRLGEAGNVGEARLLWIRYSDGLMGYFLEIVSLADQDSIISALHLNDIPSELFNNTTLDVMVRAASASPDIKPFYTA